MFIHHWNLTICITTTNRIKLKTSNKPINSSQEKKNFKPRKFLLERERETATAPLEVGAAAEPQYGTGSWRLCDSNESKKEMIHLPRCRHLHPSIGLRGSQSPNLLASTAARESGEGRSRHWPPWFNLIPIDPAEAGTRHSLRNYSKKESKITLLSLHFCPIQHLAQQVIL